MYTYNDLLVMSLNVMRLSVPVEGLVYKYRFILELKYM